MDDAVKKITCIDGGLEGLREVMNMVETLNPIPGVKPFLLAVDKALLAVDLSVDAVRKTFETVEKLIHPIH